MVYELSPASLEMIDGFADEAETLINGAVTEQWEATFANPKSPAYLGIPIKEGVNTALEKTGMPTLTAPRMVELDPAVNQYLEARGGKYVTWLTDSGKKDLKALLVKAYQENGTLSGFQKVFREQYPQMQRWKATQIWVTESGLAANNAQLSAYEQIDDVIGFRTILGPNPCPICRFQHSYDHKLGQDPPLYHVFCACLTEPIIKGVHKFREGKGDPSEFMDDKVYKRLNSSYKDFRKESILKIDLSGIIKEPGKGTHTLYTPNAPAKTITEAEEWAKINGAQLLPKTPTDAADMVVSDLMRIDPHVIGSKEVQEKIKANWVKEFQGQLDNLDKNKLLDVQNSINYNRSGRIYKALEDKHGKQGIIYRFDPTNTHKAGEQIGGTIHIYQTEYTNVFKNEIPYPGAITSGEFGLPAEIRHEYGHYIFDNRLTDAQRTTFKTAINNIGEHELERGITHYSKDKLAVGDEAFCELFAITTDPKYDKTKFPVWVQELGDTIMEWLL